jgi:hypothetical protein
MMKRALRGSQRQPELSVGLNNVQTAGAVSETWRLLRLLTPEVMCSVIAWLVGFLFNDVLIIEYMATNLRYLVASRRVLIKALP